VSLAKTKTKTKNKKTKTGIPLSVCLLKISDMPLRRRYLGKGEPPIHLFCPFPTAPLFSVIERESYSKRKKKTHDPGKLYGTTPATPAKKRMNDPPR
jgi:hypothetical protein